jgi:hypothetical protein
MDFFFFLEAPAAMIPPFVNLEEEAVCQHSQPALFIS